MPDMTYLGQGPNTVKQEATNTSARSQTYKLDIIKQTTQKTTETGHRRYPDMWTQLKERRVNNKEIRLTLQKEEREEMKETGREMSREEKSFNN